MGISHCNHNYTDQTDQGILIGSCKRIITYYFFLDVLLSPIVFDSANLSDQGLTSFKELIALYNMVTDGDHLSVDDGTADRLVNTGTWPRMDCWKVSLTVLIALSVVDNISDVCARPYTTRFTLLEGA